MKTLRSIEIKAHYDVVIVGGGIQGCAMLWEAQSRGLKTLLVEADDFCAQTSANSLKTIHGGIRYLQSLNLARTWRSSREPEVFLDIAPHLVHPLACILPTQAKLMRSRFVVGVGFTFYNLIKTFSCPKRELPWARCLSKSKLSEYTDVLDDSDITGAGLWYDAQVQHAQRLGLAFVRSAQDIGAQAYNYLSADRLSKTGANKVGIELVDRLTGHTMSVTADNAIYCTASMTGENLASNDYRDTDFPSFTLAANLVVSKPYSKLAIGLESGFDSRDTDGSGRLLFAAPWQNKSLFGTWYFDSKIDSGAPLELSAQQLAFCLDDVNKTYPGLKLGLKDIYQVHCGLLPLIGAHSNPDKDLMESDQIHQLEQSVNVFAVIPTKYTTCRVTAERMIDKLAKHSGKAIQQSVSATTQLVGGRLNMRFSEFVECYQEKLKDEFTAQTIEQLIISYGDQIEAIVEICKQDKTMAQFIPGSNSHIKAQLVYELMYGQVHFVDDFTIRRSFLGNSENLDQQTIDYCSQAIDKRCSG